jgi:ABC-type polysaccharide/polyol phosphate transport system ATPase subunit
MQNKNEQKNTVAISVKNVSKQFSIPHEKISSIKIAFINLFKKNTSENFYALKDVSFEVKKGEFFGILGRNGSGKSTLLKILAGVYTADKGHIHLNGLVSPFLELGIGFNPELSGRDNIYLNATVLGLTEKEIGAKFDSIVAFSELERFIDQKVKNYSSGMNVRLAFSVALHANREILLMDEVLAVGDSNFQSKCLREFARYKEMGKTVILVTHDIGTVQRYCDRAMLLRNGEIAMIGSAEEVGNEYIYQNMSDEEKRIIKEQEQAKIKAEKDMAQAQIEAEKLKGKALEDEKSRLEAEKLRQAEEQKHLEEERKNKVAEITGVEFLDKDGKSKNTFETGESMDIRIDFKLNKKDVPFNVGVGLHSITGGQVFGYNTQMDNYLIDKNSKNIIIHFDTLPVLKGEYSLNVACWGDFEQNHYDYKPGCRILKIFSSGIKNNYRGFCDIKHGWIVN